MPYKDYYMSIRNKLLEEILAATEGGGGEFTGAPSNILFENNNAGETTVDGNPDNFVSAVATVGLAPPTPGYATNFKPLNVNILNAIHDAATDEDYRVAFSGTITASDPAFLGAYIGVKVDTSLGQEFTGGAKFYPVGVSFGPGGSPAVGFSITVYGKFAPDEIIQLKVSSNTAGTLTLSDVIFSAVKITPAG